MKRLFYIINIVLLSGCASMYIPETPNIPLHTEKGETKINAGVSTNSFMLSGSHSISDTYALMGGAYVSYGNMFESYDLGEMIFPYFGGDFKHYNFNLGLGKYYPFSDIKVFEVYGGAGYGRAYISKDTWHENNYGNIFIQANFGRKEENLELGYMFRLNGAYMHYNHIYRYYNHTGLFSEHRTENFPVVSAQWGLLLKAGGKRLKFLLSPSLNLSYAFIDKSYAAANLDFNEGKFYTAINITIGLHYKF